MVVLVEQYPLNGVRRLRRYATGSAAPVPTISMRVKSVTVSPSKVPDIVATSSYFGSVGETISCSIITDVTHLPTGSTVCLLFVSAEGARC